MDDLKNKHDNGINSKNDKKNTSSDNTLVNMLTDKLNYISFGYLGTFFKWMCDSIGTKGIWGLIQSIILFTTELLQKSQYYPNKFFHYSFGFVTKPFKTTKSTKSISKSKQST